VVPRDERARPFRIQLRSVFGDEIVTKRRRGADGVEKTTDPIESGTGSVRLPIVRYRIITATVSIKKSYFTESPNDEAPTYIYIFLNRSRTNRIMFGVGPTGGAPLRPPYTHTGLAPTK